MNKSLLIVLIFWLMVLFSFDGSAQKDTLMKASTFSGLEFRSIGPAFMSGRIADIAIHPEDDNLWYVGVGSGNIWKTRNAGTTWEPVFEDQGSYSIGCVAVDPNAPETVWAGTGENVGGRHVGYGDGIYRSQDGGKHWKNMGLKESEHISRIVIHPENSQIIWVAAQGPLWNKGGQRGVYKTTDGGKTWTRVLEVNEWTGATDLLMDPRNPDRLYAATWQRHRNVAAYMGGGPGSGIYRSEDGGETWKELKKGLPKGYIGKTGLAISPQKPDVLYAAMELERRSGAVYRSTNRGESWEKGSETVAGGTGPHYYQELYASPHKFDRIYLADVRMQVSEDGGKTFRTMKEQYKHSDNHALAFRDDDPDYLLAGTDGGLYESFDLAENWRFIANLPVTQFYKIAVDDAKPFYNIYGGTQDNNTQMGPSQTANYHGIRNDDWQVVLFADGHQPATEPGNPDIAYAEWQQGNLVRLDRKTGESVYIQPQPGEGGEHERFNWDAPILVSPHSPTRLYYGSYRVWRSNNRGDSWETVSGDLTRDQERMNLPVMGKQQSWDATWDFLAMSEYNTITSLAESPLEEGLLYAGTDDGLIQVSENGGEDWRRIEVGDLPGVPETAFVNDIKADLHDPNTVYVALDNHKYGDFAPYLLKSTNRGRSWSSISSNLPERTLVWRLVQDHEKPALMFAATEFGIYFTLNGGERWTQFTGKLPVIAFRDLAIQQRENDLIGASFGRGIFVLDDYELLRTISEETLKQEAVLFAPEDAGLYQRKSVLGFSKKGSQGAAHFTAPNPPFGAVFTYYLKEGLKTREALRKEKEKAVEGDIPFPGWDSLDKEYHEADPEILLMVTDAEGNAVRRISGPPKKGFHRVAWDLRYPSNLLASEEDMYSSRGPRGVLVVPGTYQVALYKQYRGEVTRLSEPKSFEVDYLYDGALERKPEAEMIAFRQSLAEMRKAASAANKRLGKALKRIKAMQRALAQAEAAPGELDEQLHDLRAKALELQKRLQGSPARRDVGERRAPNLNSRLSKASMGTRNNTYGPTNTHKKSLNIARKRYAAIRGDLQSLIKEQIPEMEQALEAAGAPWLEGQDLPGNS